jgi:hypothetical protein
MVYHDKMTSCPEYLEKFQNCIDVLEHYGGSIRNVHGLMNEILEDKKINPDLATNDRITDALKEAQEHYIAIAFLCGSDHHWYGKLLENLENEYTQGQDNYPKTKDRNCHIQMPDQLETGLTQHNVNHRSYK